MEILWLYFRNGLAHGFAVCYGGYEGNAGGPYFVPHDGILEINPASLLDDLSNGFDKYLLDLRAASDADTIYKNFDAVFTSVFINGK
jgi:hypothetical protein